MDIGILLIFLFVRTRLTMLRRFLDILAATAIVYTGFLIGISSTPIPLLRMYFYVELFRTLMVCVIVSALLGSRYGRIAVIPVLLVSVVYVEMRIASSPFFYDGGVVEHLFRPIFSNN